MYIKNALTNAGKTVTVFEREVSVPGWRGTGYMVIDPVTGDGAYMISGGGNGGFIATDLAFLITIQLFVADYYAGGGKILISVLANSIFAGLGLASNFLDLIKLYNGTPECLGQLIFVFTIELAMTFIAVVSGLVGAFVLNIINIIIHSTKILAPDCSKD